MPRQGKGLTLALGNELCRKLACDARISPWQAE